MREPVPWNEHINGGECRKVMADLVCVGVGHICFLAGVIELQSYGPAAAIYLWLKVECLSRRHLIDMPGKS